MLTASKDGTCRCVCVCVHACCVVSYDTAVFTCVRGCCRSDVYLGCIPRPVFRLKCRSTVLARSSDVSDRLFLLSDAPCLGLKRSGRYGENRAPLLYETGSSCPPRHVHVYLQTPTTPYVHHSIASGCAPFRRIHESLQKGCGTGSEVQRQPFCPPRRACRPPQPQPRRRSSCAAPVASRRTNRT